MRQTLQLRYAGIEVGIISDAFCSDDTWFGLFRETLEPANGPTEKRLHEFIIFSEEWHVREKADLPTTADEWNTFCDLYGRWQTVDSGGVVTALCDAPVFVEGEVTWATASDVATSYESKRDA